MERVYISAEYNNTRGLGETVSPLILLHSYDSEMYLTIILIREVPFCCFYRVSLSNAGVGWSVESVLCEKKQDFICDIQVL